MQVFCPKCGTGTDVSPGAQRASCGQCGEVLPVHMPAYGPPEMGPTPQAFGIEDMAAVGTVKPPVTTFAWNEAQTPDGAWVVGLRGRGPGCAFVLGIGFLGATVFAAAQWGSGSGGSEVRAVFLALAALYLAYKALCAAVNRSTLRLDGDYLAVQRGPVPELGSVRIATSAIAGFDLVRGATVTSGATKTVYHVVRAVGVGAPARLPLGMLPREQADFVAKRLGEMLADVQRRAGIAPPPMPFQGPPAF